jgi:hypothetical protein
MIPLRIAGLEPIPSTNANVPMEIIHLETLPLPKEPSIPQKAQRISFDDYYDQWKHLATSDVNNIPGKFL